MRKVLIIDDDPDICLLLKRFLNKHGYEATETFTGENGLQQLKRLTYDVVLCDFRLPDMDGLEMLKAIKEINPRTQVIIITGYSDVKVAVKAMKMGAFEYVTKPIHPEEILHTIKTAIEDQTSGKSAGALKKKASGSGGVAYVKGSSTRARQLHQLIELISPTDITVVILGESGTGKEVIANAIHRLSKRADHPFVAVDCGALPQELAGSELFGHVKGAFTGALMDKRGHFESANGGTLFLDEIGNLSYENQIKLLRVLQERKIRKVGGSRDVDVDVRVIAATNEDLEKSLREGDFREDLYYRINEFRIELPPLRERKSDLMEFAYHFLNEANEELEKKIEGFESEVEEKLMNYYWHGNLRELRNVVKRAVLLAQGKKISIDCVPPEIISPIYIEEPGIEHENGEVTDMRTVVENAEKRAILQVLKKTGYNKSKAAEILKIDRKTLYNKMNAYGIEF